MRTMKRDVIHVVSGTASAKVLGLLLMMCLASTIGSTTFGYLSIGLATAALISGMASLNLGPVVTRDVAVVEGSDGLRRVASGAATVNAGALVVAIPLGLGLFYSIPGTPADLRSVVVVVALSMMAAAQTINSLILAVLHGCSRFPEWSLLTGLRATLPPAAALAVAALGSTGTSFLLLATAASEVALAIAYGRRVLWPIDRRSGSHARTLLRQAGLPLVGTCSVLFSGWALNAILLSRLGPAVAGQFALSLRVFTGSGIVASGILAAMTPRIHAAANRGDLSGVSGRDRAVDALIVSALITSAAVFILAPVLGTLGVDYQPCIAQLRIMALACLPVALNGLLGQRAIAHGAVSAWAESDIVLGFAMIAVCLVLVPSAEGRAASWAQVAAFSVSCMYLYLRLVTRGRDRRSGPDLK